MKGSVLDVVGAVTLVFFFSMMAIVGWIVLDGIETSSSYTDLGGNTTFLEQGKAAQQVWDWGILFILFGAMAFAIITAYMVDTHPALFVIGLIVFMIVLLITVVVSNTFYQFYNTAEISTAANEFPMMIYVMDHLVEIMMVFGFVLMIVLYGKLRNVGGGNI